MTRTLTYDPEKGALALGARRVGASLRACARVACVPYRTLWGWLARGHEYNAELPDAELPDERIPPHAVLGVFATEMDRAAGHFESVLHARVLKATEKDGRLALDALRWKAEAPHRTLKRRLLSAQVDVERQRASGELVERHDVTSDGRALAAMTDDEIHAHIADLAASG